MKIKKITEVGRNPVYDISVDKHPEYVLENGVITHNTGAMYAADNVWIIGRQQEKTIKDGHTGYNFTINVEKSRYVKEKSKIDITVSFEGGINKYTGLFEQAVEAGYITSEKKGWYNTVDPETGEVSETAYRAADLETNIEYWKKMLVNADFKEYITKKYRLDTDKAMIEEEVD